MNTCWLLWLLLAEGWPQLVTIITGTVGHIVAGVRVRSDCALGGEGVPFGVHRGGGENRTPHLGKCNYCS